MMESKSIKASDSQSEDAYSKSDLCNVSLYIYEWKIDDISTIMSSLSKPTASPLFSVGPCKNYDLKLLLSNIGYGRIKLKVCLSKDCRMTEEMKSREANCPLSSKLVKNELGLELLDSNGTVIEYYTSLSYEFKLINTSAVYVWTKEISAARFNDSLIIRAKLCMKFYGYPADASCPNDSTAVLVNDMKNFFNERNYSPDIIIKVGNEYVPCHKPIVYSQYPFFAELAKDDTGDASVEKYSSASKLPSSIASTISNECEILHISNENVDVLLSVLYFIYTKQMRNSLRVDYFAVHEFAKKYGVRDLSMLLTPNEIAVHSKIVVKKMKYIWYVKKFSSLNMSGQSHTQSPEFKTEIGKGVIIWNIELTCLHPNNIVLDLNARVNGKKLDIQALVKLGLYSANGSIYEEREVQYSFTHGPFHNSDPVLVESESWLLFFPDLLYNDTLTVYCDLTVSCGELSSNIKYCYPSEHPVVDMAYWINNLQKLLETENFSDVTLEVEETKFRVHKAILAARSPVFARMFESDMEEKRNGCVRIKDASSEVMKQALHYIYTCKTDDLTLSRASELYCIADKYALIDLKSKCCEFMVENLDAENSCEILIMADMFNDEKLKIAARNKICCNSAEALLSPAGSELLSNHFLLAHDLLEHFSSVFCSLTLQNTTQDI